MRGLYRILFLISLFALSGCHNRSLLSGLTESQVNDVVAILQRHGVTAIKNDLGKGVFEVDVSRADFPAAVDLVRRYNLPTPPDLQISQAFPSDSLVSTPLAEHSRLISYIEQRLSNNLSALNNVVRAHVNVSYPLTEDVDSPQRMHVAVLIVYSGELDKDTLISKVKRYVKNSFDQIDYDDISVLAEQSAPIFRGMPPSAPLISWSTDWMHVCMQVSAFVGFFALLAAGWLGLTSRPFRTRWWRERRIDSEPRHDHDKSRPLGAQLANSPPSGPVDFFKRFRKSRKRDRVEPFIK
ncbi:type III secretion system inner membrane ring lipoprotein SctJ [Xanthomonas albilineans]|uniref:type III secretion system inner membrane ring lipoprotein SctJ n=1 Tax=Xanthomonas albilineans TaxID=29447 RepID=UPI0009BC342F|nr:type III secretion inner membrane ring lipoprotein SctJ [Xanthomonas albilineans]PPU95098.1 EscJ/YscJ/HrcJ family type III secretion inner membrane ring protein [Xanthomonas albilineans]